MPERITCTHTVQVGTTLTRSVSTVLEVDAYDVIEVTVNDSATDDEVEVQPGSEVRLLMIHCDSYDPALTYKVNATGNPVRTLDQPQMFAGTGAVALLDAAAPSSLFFSNATGRNAVVSIVVGRLA
jgi:hypothetical protein